jgi:hypothetical protein
MVFYPSNALSRGDASEKKTVSTSFVEAKRFTAIRRCHRRILCPFRRIFTIDSPEPVAPSRDGMRPHSFPPNVGDMVHALS